MFWKALLTRECLRVWKALEASEYLMSWKALVAREHITLLGGVMSKGISTVCVLEGSTIIVRGYVRVCVCFYLCVFMVCVDIFHQSNNTC